MPYAFSASSTAVGKRSKKATPITAPALKPSIKYSLLLNLSANKPPNKVEKNVAQQINNTTIFFEIQIYNKCNIVAFIVTYSQL